MAEEATAGNGGAGGDGDRTEPDALGLLRRDGTGVPVLVWDLPVRVFHWCFALCVIGAVSIALFTSSMSWWFGLHSVFGLTAALLLVIRVVWGFVGTRYARWAEMPMRPKQILGYFSEVFRGQDTRILGHNPGTVLAVILMVVMFLGLATTGLIMGLTATDKLEDVHKLFAIGLLGAVALHLTGLIVHTIRFREFIAASMITGKQLARPGDGIDSPRTGVGIAILVVVLLWFGTLAVARRPEAAHVVIPGVTTLKVGRPVAP